MTVYVGLDCGGSSSRLIAVNEKSEVLYQGQAGSANLSSTPERMIGTNLRKAAEGCPTAQYVCGCFAGLLTAQDRDRAVVHLHHIFPQAEVRAEPDCMAAIFASSPIPDICVIAGTGSLVCSLRGKDLVKSGGGGYILGDDGSACMYGRDALRQFLYNREECTQTLLRAITDAFGSTEYSSVIARIYHSNSPAAVISKLAKTVAQEARSGESYAVESLEKNSSHLAKHVVKHIYKNCESSRLAELIRIATSGGLWKTDAIFREKFSQYLELYGSDLQLEVSQVQSPPVRGALKLALEMKHGN